MTGRWVVPLALLVGVLAPTACVLWFLNVAVTNQREASKRKLADAYRGQLVLLRDRADAFWEKRAADLERMAQEGTPPVVFHRIVTEGLADAVIVRDYPSLSMAATTDSTGERGDWLVARSLEAQGAYKPAADAYRDIVRSEPDVSIGARAAQGEVRCLMRAGEQASARRVIGQYFARGRLMGGIDPQGRLIAADELLLAGATQAELLRALVMDYANVSMPSGQRLFLMEQIGPDVFPTHNAERMAARFLESGRARGGEGRLEPSGMVDMWQLAAGPAIGLYHTATLVAATRGLASGLDARVAVLPPGASSGLGMESTEGGARMPGWRISLSPTGNQPFDETGRRQITSLVWLGFLAIAAVAITAVVAGQAFRRHWQRARLKTDLVAAVSHELKTPLSSMRALVDSLLDDAEPDTRKTRDYLELIARENLRLSRLIENFLTFSRLERRRQKFEFRPVEPESIVEASLEAARERWPAAEVRPEVSVEPDLPPVRADREALVTVLLNLLDNAYKYTPGEKRIAMRVRRAREGVVFEVQDNGVGIAPREQERIFRRFYQVDRRLSRETGGCGLGLSIVEFIVREHGGRVLVDSRPGAGSTFSVAIP